MLLAKTLFHEPITFLGNWKNTPSVTAGISLKNYYVNKLGIRRMKYSIVKIQLITIVETLNLIRVKLLNI